MKRSWLLALLSCFFFGKVMAQHTGIILYEHNNFKGRQETFLQSNPDLKGGKIGIHQASSIKIPPGYMVYLYEGQKYKGRFIVLYSSVSSLENTQLGNDRVASIKIEHLDSGIQKNVEGVILYDQIGFRGQSEVFFKSIRNLQDSGFGNDVCASIKMSKGMKVTLFEHGDFKGKAESLYNDDSNLGDNRIGLNSVSSLKVEYFIPILTNGKQRNPIVLFKETGFKGKSEPFFSDDPDLNDNAIGVHTIGSVKVSTGARIKSVKLPPGVRVELFSRKNYKGKSAILVNDQWDLTQTKLGKNRIGSLKVIYSGEVIRQTLQGQNIRIYSEPFYRGSMEEILTDIRSLKGHQVDNDTMMSLYIPSGMRVTLYADKDFKGHSETLLTSDPDLFDNSIGGNSVTSLKLIHSNKQSGKQSEGQSSKPVSITAKLKVTPWAEGKLGAMFDGSETRLPQGLNARYELDFDGDRSWDYSETYPPQVEFTFFGPGRFTAHLKVSIDNGQSVTISRDYTIKSKSKPKTDPPKTGVEPKVTVIAEPDVIVKTEPDATVITEPEVTAKTEPKVTTNSEEEKRVAKENYDKAYELMSRLMAEGNGESPEAQQAYEAYKKAKVRYERSRR